MIQEHKKGVLRLVCDGTQCETKFTPRTGGNRYDADADGSRVREYWRELAIKRLVNRARIHGWSIIATTEKQYCAGCCPACELPNAECDAHYPKEAQS